MAPQSLHLTKCHKNTDSAVNCPTDTLISSKLPTALSSPFSLCVFVRIHKTHINIKAINIFICDNSTHYYTYF